MSLVTTFMTVQMAQSFVFAAEINEPDASSAIAVTRQGCDAGLQLITRSPLQFSETVWLEPSDIGDDMMSMLAARVESVTPEQIADVEQLIARSEGMRVQSLPAIKS